MAYREKGMTSLVPFWSNPSRTDTVVCLFPTSRVWVRLIPWNGLASHIRRTTWLGRKEDLSWAWNWISSSQFVDAGKLLLMWARSMLVSSMRAESLSVGSIIHGILDSVSGVVKVFPGTFSMSYEYLMRFIRKRCRRGSAWCSAGSQEAYGQFRADI